MSTSDGRRASNLEFMFMMMIVIPLAVMLISALSEDTIPRCSQHQGVIENCRR